MSHDFTFQATRFIEPLGPKKKVENAWRVSTSLCDESIEPRYLALATAVGKDSMTDMFSGVLGNLVLVESETQAEKRQGYAAISKPSPEE